VTTDERIAAIQEECEKFSHSHPHSEGSPEHNSPALPTPAYYDGIMAGFEQNGIPTDTLEAALLETRKKIEAAGGTKHEQAAI
jgi:hypothetical protein